MRSGTVRHSQPRSPPPRTAGTEGRETTRSGKVAMPARAKRHFPLVFAWSAGAGDVECKQGSPKPGRERTAWSTRPESRPRCDEVDEATTSEARARVRPHPTFTRSRAPAASRLRARAPPRGVGGPSPDASMGEGCGCRDAVSELPRNTPRRSYDLAQGPRPVSSSMMWAPHRPARPELPQPMSDKDSVIRRQYTPTAEEAMQRRAVPSSTVQQRPPQHAGDRLRRIVRRSHSDHMTRSDGRPQRRRPPVQAISRYALRRARPSQAQCSRHRSDHRQVSPRADRHDSVYPAMAVGPRRGEFPLESEEARRAETHRQTLPGLDGRRTTASP